MAEQPERIRGEDQGRERVVELTVDEWHPLFQFQGVQALAGQTQMKLLPYLIPVALEGASFVHPRLICVRLLKR